MLSKVKKALRVNHNVLDEEVEDLISAALKDLNISGVVRNTIDDPLIIRAVIVYCKAHFGLDNADTEKYITAYNMLKNQLSLSGEYNV